MKLRLAPFVLIFSLLFVFGAVSAFAQNGSFSDPNVEYTFDLPDAKWKITVKPSATSPNVEYVYGERSDGHLGVRKLTVGKNDLMSDIIQDEEQKLQFNSGFVAGKQETFAGKLKGSVFNYEYVSSARNMSGRFYFLRANDTTVYVLRFTAQKDALRSLRSQTDAIARTFAIK